MCRNKPVTRKLEFARQRQRQARMSIGGNAESADFPLSEARLDHVTEKFPKILEAENRGRGRFRNLESHVNHRARLTWPSRARRAEVVVGSGGRACSSGR